ncbi:MAG: uroporphyrinogen-III synthase [Pseudomonadota bacterium]|nr:uroporphyrinogen-III synthase [Pseudomonadota bacterium]
MVGKDKQTESLRGVRIALPETRELDLFAAMVTQRGGTALRHPLVAIRDTPDQAAVAAWLRRFIAGEYSDAVFYTGEGLRRLRAAADRNGIEAQFIRALGDVRKLVRGPKPERVLRGFGLRAELHATEPTTRGVIAALTDMNLAGRSLTVQVYGDAPPPELAAFVTRLRQTRVDWVAPYVYADAAQTGQVVELIDRIGDGSIDVIAFTSSAQVDRLLKVAEERRDAAALRHQLNEVLVAAVGPVVTETLTRYGISVAVQPAQRYFLKPLVRAIEAASRARAASDH